MNSRSISSGLMIFSLTCAIAFAAPPPEAKHAAPAKSHATTARPNAADAVSRAQLASELAEFQSNPQDAVLRGKIVEHAQGSLLIFLALSWPMVHRAVMGKVMAVLILGPAALAGWEAVQRFSEPSVPKVLPLVLASVGAIAINGTSAWLLTRVRHHGGSLSRAAFLSARNDVLVNLSIIAMAAVTVWTSSGWPDLILGCFIIGLALFAAHEVWEASEEERLAAKALAGDID